MLEELMKDGTDNEIPNGEACFAYGCSGALSGLCISIRFALENQ